MRTALRRWCRRPRANPGRSRSRRARPTKLTLFRQIVKQPLKADAHRPKRDRRTARMLYEELRAAGYGGGYTRLTDFIRVWRKGEGSNPLWTSLVSGTDDSASIAIVIPNPRLRRLWILVAPLRHEVEERKTLMPSRSGATAGDFA
jgi:hypothetical protein